MGMRLWVRPVRMKAGRMGDQAWIRSSKDFGSVGFQSVVMALRRGGRKRV